MAKESIASMTFFVTAATSFIFIVSLICTLPKALARFPPSRPPLRRFPPLRLPPPALHSRPHVFFQKPNFTDLLPPEGPPFNYKFISSPPPPSSKKKSASSTPPSSSKNKSASPTPP